VIIRDLQTIDDLKKVAAVEREVWGLSDADLFPLTATIASKAAGHMWIGAFDGDELAGFAYAFPSMEDGNLKLHSHMLAVRHPYRDQDLGYKLKLAQREHALKDFRVGDFRITDMTWTFDPLQSMNAHFNFSKLGVVSDSYRINFYGPETSSALHRTGTDRLWVRWPISSGRVEKRVKGASTRNESWASLNDVEPLVSSGKDGRAKRGNLLSALSKQKVEIQIPNNISTLEMENMDAANDWRAATRWSFSESLAAGFFVAEFFRATPAQNAGTYLLLRGDIDAFTR
jgi:predicted GNAT superfamily acetyltransferase